MKVHRGSWVDWDPTPEKSSATIGVLDGVHRGHQTLIATLNRDLVRTVLTFDPHPLEVLRPGTKPRLITTIDERIARLDSLGIDQVGVLDLSEIRDLSPREFVDEVLVEKLNVGDLVVGPDFRFGKDRIGRVDLLRSLGESSVFTVRVLDLVRDGEDVVSSSRIREMIESGHIREAEGAMGVRYQMTNTVIAGDRRGTGIGFPTANLLPPERKVLPAIGVYAAFVRISDEVYSAAVNVGVRPTFGGGDLLVEAFILDYSSEIYGEELTIEFVDYLRPELEFDDVDSLVLTMRSDVEECRRLLAAVTSNMS